MPNQPQQLINIGSQANDGTGDNIRDAFQKVNQNFTQIYDLAITRPEVIFTITSVLTNIDFNLLPKYDLTYNIGSSDRRWKTLWVDKIDYTEIVNTATNFSFGGGTMRGSLEFKGPTDYGPTIKIRDINSAAISYYENHAMQTRPGGIYNYTMTMGQGSVNWGFSTINSAYDYGATKMSLDYNGNLVCSGEVTAYSDQRLKTNVETIPNALDKINQCRGVSFDKDGRRGLGVIAQEIQKILPEVVLEGNDENKTLSVAYGNVVGVLIEAVKELTAKVENLERLLGK
jgi:hypothetical protein